MKLEEPLLDSNNIFDSDEKIPHLIKRATLPIGRLDDIFPIEGSIWDSNDQLIDKDGSEELAFDFNMKEAVNTRPVGGLTLEVAMFFDEVAYKMFAPFMDYDNDKLQDMLLAYLNGVSKIFHSSGNFITKSMKREPNNM